MRHVHFVAGSSHHPTGATDPHGTCERIVAC